MGTSSQAAGRTPASVPSVARQPILNTDQEVFAYRLLFQEDTQDFAGHNDSPEAAIETALVVGLDVLGAGYPAFIRFTAPMLAQGCAKLLPADQVVVELDESVPADATITSLCQQLRQENYRFALSNFVPGDARAPLVPLAQFLMVHQKKVALKEGALLVKQYVIQKHKMVAEGVETRQEFWAARTFGFTHFQGYFFREPERMRARQIPANKANYMRLLQAISKREVDLVEVEKLIKQETSLCYRLLRYLNSPAFAVASPVQSIRHALAMLGERETVRWIRMATAVVMGDGKPSDLVLGSLVRARFCELVGSKVNAGKCDLFLMGMLSLMDAILEVPVGVLMEGIAVDSDTRDLLMAGKTGKETPLSPIYNLMVAREAGDWEKVTAASKQLNLSLVFVAENYNAAMKWAHEVTAAVRPTVAQPNQ